MSDNDYVHELAESHKALNEAGWEIERLRAENEKLRSALVEAKDMLEFWSSYASDYFQEKHGLSDDIAYITAAASLKEDSK